MFGSDPVVTAIPAPGDDPRGREGCPSDSRWWTKCLEHETPR